MPHQPCPGQNVPEQDWFQSPAFSHREQSLEVLGHRMEVHPGPALNMFLPAKPLQGPLPAPNPAQHSPLSGEKLLKCEEGILKILWKTHL